MSKPLAVFALIILLAGTAAAQLGGHVGVSRSGFGNVVFPGTGGPPVRGLGLYPSQGIGLPPVGASFPMRLGQNVAGYPITGYHNRGGRGAVVVPYAYPVFVGGYGYGYPDPQPQQQPIIIYQQAPAPAQPPVIINQTFTPETARPVIREYGQEQSAVQRYQAPSPASQPPDQQYYLIALNDHSIYSAVGYWQDGDTLHYLLPNNVHNQVSMALVDKQLTEQLNKDRSNPVRLR